MRLRASAAGAIALSLTATACGARSTLEDADLGVTEESIQGGYADIPDTSVLGLAITNDDGRIFRSCSGSLIAPNLVLTAQHCVASTSKFVRCDDAAFGPAVSADHLLLTTDGQMWGQSTTWRLASEVATPPGGTGVCGRDMALIILSELMTIGTLEPRLDPVPAVSEGYSAIGYGETSDGAGDGGVRRRRDSLAVTCVGDECDTDHVFADEWRGDHGICAGDSGGPAIDAQRRVIGVTSRGPSGCDDPIYGGLGLLSPWIVDTAVHAAAVGGYPAPKWSGGPGGPLREDGSSGDGSCSYSPAVELGGASGLALLALAALSLFARKGRRRNGAREAI